MAQTGYGRLTALWVNFKLSATRIALLGILLCAISSEMARAQVQLDLRDADLRSFVEIVAEATGRNYVLDSEVRGTVTVLAPDELSPADLYEVFLSVLELNRLTIVEGAGADRIVPLGTARELSDGDSSARGAAYQTRVIEVQNVPLDEIVEVVRPLLPSEAVLTTVPGSSLLILSDRAQNLARIERLIERLDRSQAQPIEMIRLRNAQAVDVLQVIQAMDIIPEGAAVSIDQRSNALVVNGPESLRQQLRVLAGQLDRQTNNVISRAVSLNYADAAVLSDVVLRTLSNEGSDGVASQVRIVPDPSTNTLLITAPSERFPDILEMVAFLDRRPAQVLVEAVIFEMSVEGYSDLSAQFGAILNDAILGGVEFSLGTRPSLTSLIAAVADGGTPSPGAGGFIGGAGTSGNDRFVGLLTAIVSERSTRLLSTPSIMTLNNQEAEIVVAQNVPFVTGSFTSTGDGAQPENPFQTIERQDVGLTLTVTPQINADDTVRMSIAQEVSNLTNAQASAGGEITARRALSTTVLVKDSNVIMLGGLLENGAGSVSDRVPGLSDLPLVGGLFRGKSASRNQRVLLVMLRPQVISDDAEARRVTRLQAREAKRVSEVLKPVNDGRYPRADVSALPFDGWDLNQPFDAGVVDDDAQARNFPALPGRLRFGD